MGILKETLKLIWLCKAGFVAVASYYVILLLFPGMKEIGFFYTITSILAVTLLAVAFAGVIVAYVILKKVRAENKQDENHFPLSAEEKR